jgi:hypothetical protein
VWGYVGVEPRIVAFGEVPTVARLAEPEVPLAVWGDELVHRLGPEVVAVDVTTGEERLVADRVTAAVASERALLYRTGGVGDARWFVRG